MRKEKIDLESTAELLETSVHETNEKNNDIDYYKVMINKIDRQLGNLSSKVSTIQNSLNSKQKNIFLYQKGLNTSRALTLRKNVKPQSKIIKPKFVHSKYETYIHKTHKSSIALTSRSQSLSNIKYANTSANRTIKKDSEEVERLKNRISELESLFISHSLDNDELTNLRVFYENKINSIEKYYNKLINKQAIEIMNYKKENAELKRKVAFYEHTKNH